MKISLSAIKELRDMTCSSVAHCRKALEDAKGDIKQAVILLRKQGLEIAAKKQSRAAKEGRVDCYIHHGNKIGVLLEVNCESDFVARNDDFKLFVKDIAMQIAASSPLYLKKEDIPAEAIKKETEIIKAQIKDKPAVAVEKITEGKLNKFYEDVCLLEQPFIKDSNLKVKDILTSMIAKIGENVVIKRFVRYMLGDE